MARLKDLLEARAKHVADMRALTDAPSGEGGDLSDEQSTRFDALKTELEGVEKRIARQQVLDDVERRMQGQQLTGSGDDFEREKRSFSITRAIAARIEPGSVDAAREIEVGQELARRAGRPVTGVLVPIEALLPQTERRVLTVAGDGSNLVQTTVLANEFIDALRPSSVAVRLGARTITDLRDSISLPKMDALTPAAAWVAENNALMPGDHSFTQVTGTPKHLGLLTELSRKLVLQSNPAIEQIVRADFVAKLGAGVDFAALKGGGAPQPTGITNSSPGTKNSGSAAPAWADVVEVMAEVETADVPQASLGWAMNAFGKKKFRSVEKTTNEPVYLMGDDNQMGGAPVAVTSQLDGDPGVSPAEDGEVIFGAWNQIIIAFWNSLEILVNPYESTAYSKGNIQIRGFMDADVLVRHPQAFVHWTAIDLT